MNSRRTSPSKALTLKWVTNKDNVFALGTRGQERHGRADQLLNPAHIFDGLGRELGPGARAGRRARPAFELLIDRLDARLRALAHREVIEIAAVEPVAHADPEGLEAVEHVELGERHPVNPGDAHGLAHEHGVEPAAAPLAPRHGAEFAAPLAEPLARVVGLLGRERALADARRIGFGD